MHAFDVVIRRSFMIKMTLTMLFAIICEIMEKEYNSGARKLQVKYIL